MGNYGWVLENSKMARYAVVQDSDNMVSNTVVWDGEAQWSPPTGTTAVEDTGGTASINGWYESGVGFHPAMPKITGINPSSGGAAGGTTVTITGLNLATAGVIVKFDGTEATNLTNITDASLDCDTPSHAAGAVDVTVENTAGSWTGQNTLTDGFEYTS